MEPKRLPESRGARELELAGTDAWIVRVHVIPVFPELTILSLAPLKVVGHLKFGATIKKCERDTYSIHRVQADGGQRGLAHCMQLITVIVVIHCGLYNL